MVGDVNWGKKAEIHVIFGGIVGGNDLEMEALGGGNDVELAAFGGEMSTTGSPSGGYSSEFRRCWT